MKNYYLHKYQLLRAQHKPFKPCIAVAKVYGYWFVIMDSFLNPVESNCWNLEPEILTPKEAGPVWPVPWVGASFPNDCVH